VLVILAWLLGTFGDELPRGAARSAGLPIHISAGLAVLGLLTIRIVWRVVDPPPPPIATPLGNILIRIGRIAHFALYSLLAATPAVGILVQSARGDALPLYGLVEVASP
jgi:cytochrome b561